MCTDLHCIERDLLTSKISFSEVSFLLAKNKVDQLRICPLAPTEIHTLTHRDCRLRLELIVQKQSSQVKQYTGTYSLADREVTAF